LKSILKKYFSNFLYFYSFLGNRLFVAVILNIGIGILDGFGLTMFLPLLKLSDKSQTMGKGDLGLGKFSFINDWLQATGVSITLVSLLGLMVIFFLLKGIVKYFNGVYRVMLQQYFIKNLRMKMLTWFNKMSFRSFVSSDVGRIQNSMSGEVDRVARGYNMYFQTFEQSILVFVYIGFAFAVDFKFATLVTAGGLATNIIYSLFYKLTKQASSRLTLRSNLYQGQIIQHVGNFKYLKATAYLNDYSKKLEATISEIEHVRTKIGLYGSVLQAVREPLLIIIVAIVILIQVNFLGGSISSIMVSLLFFYRALNSLTSMQGSWNKFLETSGSIENLKKFQKELTRNAEIFGKVGISKFNKVIELKNVSVNYGTSVVLDNLSLSINKNDTLAFVGESGSGKTTLVNVVAGLIIPDMGVMSIDGIDRKEINILTYQKRLGYVTQEPVIFNDTIYNNITFWAEQTEDNINKFKSAIEKSSLVPFIESLPEREFSTLGINGVNISGGQKQRISIARELFKEIDILVLDEATSALDTETERSIQESIDNLKGYYTIVVVAHRLSTVKNADRIAVMNKGRIVDIGTFEELVSRNNMFKRMVELQEVSLDQVNITTPLK
jgi:subfamily B ATP-binding cassette protein MsbA